MSKQKKSYPGSVEILCWKGAFSDFEVKTFLDFAHDKFPCIGATGGLVGLSGSGWQNRLEAEKFFPMLERRGSKGLRAFVFRDIDFPLDVRIHRHADFCDRLNLSCLESEWQARGGKSIIDELLSLITVDYGHFNDTKYFNIDHFHRIAASPTFGGSSIAPWEPPANNKLLPACEYFEIGDWDPELNLPRFRHIKQLNRPNIR